MVVFADVSADVSRLSCFDACEAEHCRKCRQWNPTTDTVRIDFGALQGQVDVDRQTNRVVARPEPGAPGLRLSEVCAASELPVAWPPLARNEQPDMKPVSADARDAPCWTPEEPAPVLAQEPSPEEKVQEFLKVNGFRSVKGKRRRLLTASYPLHVAVQQKDAELVRLLLASAADPLQTNSFGRTPLQLARRCNAGGSNTAVLRELSSSG